MNILNSSSVGSAIPQSNQCINKCEKPAETIAAKPVEEKKDILDIFSEKVVNPRDINDMVTTPRSIFKGYLCFTAGTAINGIAGMIKNEKAKKPLLIAGSLISIIGTFNFVKPFLIRSKQNLTQAKK